MIRRFFFRRAVKVWRTKVRLYAELVKEIKRLQAECLVPGANPLVTKLNITFLDLIMPDYRELDDELRNRHMKKFLTRVRA